MTTDRELLELAAKSVGLFGLDFVNTQQGRFWVSSYGYWNPLTDDGDALRLAVKLDIGLVHGWEWFPEETGLATVWVSYGGQCLAEEIKGDDPYAATRRAIVRAAAEIGRSRHD